MSPTVPIWAVEADEHAVTAARVRRTPDNALELLAWWTVPVAPGDDPLRTALDALRRRGLRDHGIQVVLPGRGATCRSFRISPEDADLSPAELERELLDFTPFEPEEVALRARRLGGPGVLDYRLVAERRAEVSRWQHALEEAGFRFVGISLHPAALLTAMEAMHLGPARGYALSLQGTWSTLTAVDGAQSVRFPIPFGMRDLERRVAELDPGLTPEEVLEAVPGSPDRERAWRVLLDATAPLGEDLRRAVDFHRATLRGTGEETMLLVGPGTEHGGLRSALAQRSPVPLAPLLKLEAVAPLRPGPNVRPEAMLEAMPLLVVPLGAALTATGLASRDLDFLNLPADLPPPRERSLYPVAAAVLAASLAAAFGLAADARSALAAGEAAVREAAAIPSPAAGPEEGRRVAEELLRAAGEARRRAALSRAVASVVAAHPAAGGDLPVRTESLRVARGDEGYEVSLRIRVGGNPAADREGERARLAPVLGPLEAAGWVVIEAADGAASLRRAEPDLPGGG